jgi:hypothetical protein
MAGTTRARLRKPPSFKERVEQNFALFVMGVVFSGFVAGMGAYRELLSIAHLAVVSTQELEQCKALKKQAENTPHTAALSAEVPGGGQRPAPVKAEPAASAPKAPQANAMPFPSTSKASPREFAGVRNHRPLSQRPVYSGPVDPDILCKRLFSAEYAGSLTPTGVECRSEAEGREVAASDTCLELYGSRRFSVEPATLSLMCDTSMLTPMPCRTDQRRCGLRAESCCPTLN